MSTALRVFALLPSYLFRSGTVIGLFIFSDMLLIVPAFFLTVSDDIIHDVPDLMALLILPVYLGALYYFKRRLFDFASFVEFGRSRAIGLLNPNLPTLLSFDRRPPVLFLRAFGDDNFRFPRRKRSKLRVLFGDPFYDAEQGTFTVEQLVAECFSECGPVIAIGRPNDLLPTRGAARQWVSDNEWQERVSSLLERCRVVVMVVGQPFNNPGLCWEFEQVMRYVSTKHVVFLMPPVSDQEAIERWTQYRKLAYGRLRPLNANQVAMLISVDDRSVFELKGDRRSPAGFKCALLQVVGHVGKVRRTGIPAILHVAQTVLYTLFPWGSKSGDSRHPLGYILRVSYRTLFCVAILYLAGNLDDYFLDKPPSTTQYVSSPPK